MVNAWRFLYQVNMENKSEPHAYWLTKGDSMERKCWKENSFSIDNDFNSIGHGRSQRQREEARSRNCQCGYEERNLDPEPLGCDCVAPGCGRENRCSNQGCGCQQTPSNCGCDKPYIPNPEPLGCDCIAPSCGSRNCRPQQGCGCCQQSCRPERENNCGCDCKCNCDC